MREILFRGKRTDNGEWAYGDLIQLFGGQKYIIDNKFGACIDDKGNFINTEAPFVCKVIPETVVQYTGLKDKNGKKIFEGDIIRVEHDLWHGENKKTRESDIGVVLYNTNTAEFGVKIPGYSNCLTLRRWKGDFNEVIGNIHDKKLEDFENGC